MKLKKLLPYIDGMMYVEIWQNISLKDENFDIVFEGYAMDIPWIYTECKLLTIDENDGDEAISIYQKDNKTILSMVIKEG